MPDKPFHLFVLWQPFHNLLDHLVAMDRAVRRALLHPDKQRAVSAMLL
jgi:hypothetical protein